MKYFFTFFLTGILCPVLLQPNARIKSETSVYDVRSFGATGDGKALDTKAIDDAIETAYTQGGGTVVFPPGTYLSFSIHLKSNIEIRLSAGAILLAADHLEHHGGYDDPEPNIWGDENHYQDFGHSHWHNSLIWGEDLENVSVTGMGMIYGKGLSRTGPRRRGNEQIGVDVNKGMGNKAIALKNCRNVTLRDFTIKHGGHIGILATGVDNFTIDNLKIDTNRDAIDIDCCKNVHVLNCTANSPNDDAIVLKSSYGLGYARATENVTISNCQVTGYDEGSLLDGTYQRTQQQAPDRGGVTGRIKLGTESNGGFRNITISNCVFDRSRGLALETVDGGVLEDLMVSNITMRDVTNAPFFLRLGRRMRGPDGVAIGKLRRVNISDVVVYNVPSRYGAMIMGIPGNPIEDVQLNNVRIWVDGGAPKEQGLVEVPEMEDGYPDPRLFGDIPVYGFFIRHAKKIELNNVEIRAINEDFRPAIILDDVQNIAFNNLKSSKTNNVPTFILKNVRGVDIKNCEQVKDQTIQNVESGQL
jgi:polygalacturonase